MLPVGITCFNGGDGCQDKLALYCDKCDIPFQICAHELKYERKLMEIKKFATLRKFWCSLHSLYLFFGNKCMDNKWVCSGVLSRTASPHVPLHNEPGFVPRMCSMSHVLYSSRFTLWRRATSHLLSQQCNKDNFMFSLMRRRRLGSSTVDYTNFVSHSYWKSVSFCFLFSYVLFGLFGIFKINK